MKHSFRIPDFCFSVLLFIFFHEPDWKHFRDKFRKWKTNGQFNMVNGFMYKKFSLSVTGFCVGMLRF